jgi:hypothetical protein
MQFFFLLLFNVFLGAVLYLVISLKLERSATEWRERRFRREMDEIIKEFNVTAERNISLLERRIRVLRMLLEKTGDLQSLDITLAEEEAEQGESPAAVTLPGAVSYPEQAGAGLRGEIPVPRHDENNAGLLIKKGLILLFDKIKHILTPGKPPGAHYDGIFMDPQSDFETREETPGNAREAGVENAKHLLERDLSAAVPAGSILTGAARIRPSEQEIADIVATANDRYSLVSVLFQRGCEIEEISMYSGIPAGEVRLVLNLNLNRETGSNSL